MALESGAEKGLRAESTGIDCCWGVRALYTKVNRLIASTKVCVPRVASIVVGRVYPAPSTGWAAERGAYRAPARRASQTGAAIAVALPMVYVLIMLALAKSNVS